MLSKQRLSGSSRVVFVARGVRSNGAHRSMDHLHHIDHLHQEFLPNSVIPKRSKNERHSRILPYPPPLGSKTTVHPFPSFPPTLVLPHACLNSSRALVALETSFPERCAVAFPALPPAPAAPTGGVTFTRGLISCGRVKGERKPRSPGSRGWIGCTKENQTRKPIRWYNIR